MKCVIIDWITPKGQMLNLHIPRNAKSGQGFHHECTGALLCPAGYDWSNTEYAFRLLRLGLVTSRSSYTGSVLEVISSRIRIERVVLVFFDV